MLPIGLMLSVLGVWLVDSAYHSRGPLKALKGVLGDPKNARATLTASNRKGATGTPLNQQAIVQSPNNASGSYDPGHYTATIPGEGNTAGADSLVVQMVLAFAHAQLGKPYVWGATGPNSFDCSGFVQASFKAAGVSLPRTTFQQILVGRAVAHKDLKPGDLVFPDVGHVGIYTGNGNYIEAPHSGAVVREVPVWGFLTARRVA